MKLKVYVLECQKFSKQNRGAWGPCTGGTNWCSWCCWDMSPLLIQEKGLRMRNVHRRRNLIFDAGGSIFSLVNFPHSIALFNMWEDPPSSLPFDLFKSDYMYSIGGNLHDDTHQFEFLDWLYLPRITMRLSIIVPHQVTITILMNLQHRLFK